MKRSKHTLSHYNLMTGDMGKLYPIGCQPVLPGDTMQHSVSGLIRMSPLNTPVMHPVNIRVHHFFVPYRLLWDEWEDFITGGADGNQRPQVPWIAQPAGDKSVYDYLGVKGAGVGSPATLVAFPVRAYNLIYNEFYRDQDLGTVRTEDQTGLANISWEKDYFSGARPWTQKGSDVTLPLGTRAPVKGIGKDTQTFGDVTKNVYESDDTNPTYATAAVINGEQLGGDQDEHFYVEQGTTGYPNIWADLSNASAINVNDLRTAFALQRWQEARARYGSRYTEYLRYLGVNPADARLQRPEYLGGGHQRINFSEVLQTTPAGSAGVAGVGDLYGHGVAGVRSNAYRKFFQEHGIVMTMMSARPKAMYNDGVPREFLKFDREDYWQKELQHVGQQQIRTQEVYSDSNFDDTFGYADRYREYKEKNSYISGEFRNTLNTWHLARQFSSPPVLNQSFTDCEPSKRIFQITNPSLDTMWCMFNHHLVARRLVSRSAAPRVF